MIAQHRAGKIKLTVYYQHIGHPLWMRDAPKSLGTPQAGVVRFQMHDIENYFDHVLPGEIALLKEKVRRFAAEGFQIWGLPEGAARVISNMGDGDFLMLLESDEFRFLAQVLHKISEPCPDLSRSIWGEGRFSQIVILQGEMIAYPWSQFCTDFAFAPGYHMQGNTMRLAQERLNLSSWGDEEAFVAHLITTMSLKKDDLIKDFKLFSDKIASHIRAVKIRVGQQRFRQGVFALHGGKCAFCSMQIDAALDAAHIVPKEHEGTDDPRNGIPLCAVHHRLFDAGCIAIEPKSLNIVPRSEFSCADMNISENIFCGDRNKGTLKSFGWRWDNLDQH